MKCIVIIILEEGGGWEEEGMVCKKASRKNEKGMVMWHTDLHDMDQVLHVDQ